MDQALEQKFSVMDSDPQFQALSYEQQSSIRAANIAKIAMQDPSFQALPDDQKQAIVESGARRTPALQDKGLESLVSNVVGSAKQGDPKAMSMFSGLAGLNTEGQNSLIDALTAKALGVMNVSILPGVTSQQQRILMDGSDAAKLHSYFSDLQAKDPSFAKTKTATDVQGMLAGFQDWVPLSLIPGTEAAGAAKAGVAAAKLTSRVAMNAGKLVIPALVNTGVGAIGNVVKQNAMAVVQENPQLYTDTAQKFAASVWDGAVFNFLFSLGLGAAAQGVGAIATLVRGPVGAKKIADLDKAIQASGGTGSVPPEVLKSLYPYDKDTAWLRNFTIEAAHRDASTIDLRPLDQTVIAVNNDMPDVRFAPKDWTKPTDSGFNIWEMKAAPGKSETNTLKILKTGEADSLGDLRSKLADMLSARYDGIDTIHQPESMNSSKSLIIQGKLQAVNAKAYDPFPEKVEEGFTRPELRGYVSPTEAQDAAASSVAKGGVAIHVKVDASKNMMDRIADNKSFLSDGAPLRVSSVTPDNANSIAIITNPANPQAVQAAEAFAQKAVQHNAGWTVPEAKKFYLTQQGFDGVVNADGTADIFFPSRMKWITNQFDEAIGKLKPSSSEKLAASSPLGARISIQSKIESSIGSESLASSPTALAKVAMSKFKGDIAADDVKNFTTQLIDAKGIDHEGIQVRKISGAIDTLGNKKTAEVIRNPDKTITINVPQKITGFGSQKTFVTELVSGIDALGNVEHSKQFKSAFTKAVNNAPSRFELPFDTDSANQVWLRSVVKGEFGGDLFRTPDGSYSLTDASGRVQKNFSNLSDVRDSVMMSSLDENHIRGDLLRQGYKLTGKTGEPYTLGGPGLSKPISGTNLQDILKAIDYRPSSISNRLAPRDVQFEEGRVITTFDGSKMLASKQDVLKTLSKFENPDELAHMVGVAHSSNGDAFKLADGSIRVDVPGLAVTRYFKNIDDAKAFLSSDMKDIETLHEVAGRKGVSLYYDNANGGYTLGDGSKVIHAKNADEVTSVLKNYPDAPGAREVLSALDPQADSAIKAVIDKLDPEMSKKWKSDEFNRTLVKWDVGSLDSAIFEHPREPGRIALIKQATRDITSTYNRYSETTIGSELGLRDFVTLRNFLKRGHDMASRLSNDDQKIIASIFTDERGKPMTPQRRQAIAAYKEAEGRPDSLAGVKETFGDLSSHEQMQLSRLDKLTDNWFKRFGINSETYIKGYVSHIRDYVLTHHQESSLAIDAMDILEKAYNGKDNVPPKLAAYFRNERAETLLNATMENDPLKIFSHYVEQGNREMFLKQPIQDTVDYLRIHAKDLPSDVIQHTLYDMQVMSGHHSIEGMDKAANFLGALHDAFSKVLVLNKALKPTDAATGYKMFQNMMGLTYLGKVGFRAWPALKAMIAPYQTLAPRIGLAPVMEASRQVLGSGGRAILERLASEGELLGDVPAIQKVTGGNFSKLERKSMEMLWSGDNVQRGMTAVAAENMLDEGIRSWNSGAFKGDIDKFKHFTKVSQLGKGQSVLQDQIAKLATSGDEAQIKQAKVLFGKELIDQTAPNYGLYQQPHAVSSNIFGYVYGRLGTWSQAYREGIYRGWQNSDGIAGKAAYVGRFVGIGVALAAASKAVGVDGRDFLPGFASLFGGGPQFTTAVNILQSPGQYKQGTQARLQLEKEFSPIVYNEQSGSMKGNIPSALPGSLQAHYLKEMLDAMDEGDYLKAVFAATGAPILK